MRYGAVGKTFLLTAAAAFASSGHAQTAANRIAAQRLSPFTTLNSTQAGRDLLAQSLETSIAINNRSTSAQRSQAISDNQIITDQGIQFSTALGSRLSNAYSAAATAQDPRLATGGNVVQMFRAFTAISGADSNFNKFFLANGTTDGRTPAAGVTLPPGGIFDTYDIAYGIVPGSQDPSGDSRPFQVAPGRIDPFASSITSSLVANPAFPSGHTTFGQTEALLTAVMVPERFQQLLSRGSEYGFSRVVLGAHHVLDVIAGRILAYQDVAALLNNDPVYTNGRDYAALFAAATTDYRAVLAAGCGGTVAACAAAPATSDALGNLAQDKADYTYRLTYGLPAVGRTDLPPVVPTGAEVLLASRFPYLTAQQRSDVLASTELPSGVPLDDGSGWARLNLFAAGGGYGALTGVVTVTQDARLGGFNAFDTWSNDIGGTGSLAKAGTGTLALSGTNSFAGGVTITGGTLLLLSDRALPAAGGVVNAATLSLADGTAGGIATTSSYTGRTGSVLALDADLTRGVADRMVVTGTVTAGTATTIIVSDVSGGAAANSVGGIPLVTVQGGAIPAGAFTLAGGAIDRGLLRYQLGGSAQEVALVALPSADAQRLPAIVTGAQDLWFDGTAAWADHEADARDGTADDHRGVAVWGRGFGRWLDRDQSSTVSAAGATAATVTGYDQRTNGFLAGVDLAVPGVLAEGDRLTAGVTGGYLHSRQNFKASSTHATQDGGSVGLSLAYQTAGGLFVDAYAKADLTRLKIAVPAFAGYGADRARRREHSYGFQADLGDRLRFGGTGFVEPLATIAYADAGLNDLSLADGRIGFGNTDQVRGRLGLRAGVTMPTGGGGRLALGGDAGVWHRFTDRATATYPPAGGGADLTVTDPQVRTFGDAGGSIAFTTARGLTLFGRGGYQFASSYSAPAVTAGVRLAF